MVRFSPVWVLAAAAAPPSCFFSDERSQLGCCVADWSNGKGTGTADGWAKHKPMDDEEMLFKQVQMTAAATPGTTVWVGLTPASPGLSC